MDFLKKLTAVCQQQGGAPLPAECVLLDVRNHAEYQSGCIEGALWLPLALVPAEITRKIPDRTTPVVVYCAAGGRSAMACTAMRQMGYSQVINGGGVQQLARQMGRQVVVPAD